MDDPILNAPKPPKVPKARPAALKEGGRLRFCRWLCRYAARHPLRALVYTLFLAGSAFFIWALAQGLIQDAAKQADARESERAELLSEIRLRQNFTKELAARQRFHFDPSGPVSVYATPAQTLSAAKERTPQIEKDDEPEKDLDEDGEPGRIVRHMPTDTAIWSGIASALVFLVKLSLTLCVVAFGEYVGRSCYKRSHISLVCLLFTAGLAFFGGVAFHDSYGGFARGATAIFLAEGVVMLIAAEMAFQKERERRAIKHQEWLLERAEKESREQAASKEEQEHKRWLETIPEEERV